MIFIQSDITTDLAIQVALVWAYHHAIIPKIKNLDKSLKIREFLKFLKRFIPEAKPTGLWPVRLSVPVRPSVRVSVCPCV